MKIQAQIVWKKTIPPVNYYGVRFVLLEEKAKTELNQYIESKISKDITQHLFTDKDIL